MPTLMATETTTTTYFDDGSFEETIEIETETVKNSKVVEMESETVTLYNDTTMGEFFDILDEVEIAEIDVIFD